VEVSGNTADTRGHRTSAQTSQRLKALRNGYEAFSLLNPPSRASTTERADVPDSELVIKI
jgi:hypothetical protein